MSTTRTLQRRRPAAHGHTTAHAHAPTSAISIPIGPVDVEAALLDNYLDLVRLAYANLPARQGRHRRVLAAHGVVQRALHGHELIGVTDPKAFVRDRVLVDSIEQAQARTPLRRKPQAWGFHLLSLIEPATDDDAFDPCSLRPACRSDLALSNTRAANLVIVVTTLLALGILASLVINR